jgi:2-hydroxy-3-oxopropionate reductase
MERIGFIGLGIMGKPMAGNLLKAGYALHVHNRSRASVKQLAAEGAMPASTPKEVAEHSDVVITMLPDSPEVEQVVFGEAGVLEGIKEQSLFIDMSSIAPATARRIYEAMQEIGVEALDAPVSGGDVGAKAGTLSIMVGGKAEAFQRAQALLNALGKNIVHVGEAGAGQVTKACNQVMVALTIQAVSEALTLARNAGVDPARVREALLGGFAHSRILDLHGTRMIEGNFEPGFRMRLHRKDLRIALEEGRATGTGLFATALVAEQMTFLLGQGKGDLDHSALSLFYNGSEMVGRV